MILGLVILFSIVINMCVAYLTRGLTFYGAETDNEKIVIAAAQAGKWGWPAGMHRYAAGKARMKEAAVIALAAMQRLIGDKKSDYALVTLCILSNSISAVLIYLILANYFNPVVGMVGATLFITSFWPQLIALWGGVVAVSQVFCLFAIYFVQLGWYFPSGAMLGLTLFSSASSRKYLPLILAAFLWSLRHKMIFSGGHVIFAALFGAALVYALLVFLIKNGIRPLVKAMYLEQAPVFLNKLIKNRKEKGLEYYLDYADEKTGSLLKILAGLALYLIISGSVANNVGFWGAHFYLLTGFGVVAFWLNYPDIFENLRSYYFYSQYGKPVWRSRFYTYKEYFMSIGRSIKDDMRGAGWPWLVKYFTLMVPLPSLLFSLSLVSFAFYSVNLLAAGAMVLLGLSPILVGELTGGVQVGRSYYPGFIGLLLLIGFNVYYISEIIPVSFRIWLWSSLITCIILNAAWNIWIFLSDVLPARMAVTYLMKKLGGLRTAKIYSYATPYNDSFVNAMPKNQKDNYSIELINSLKEAKAGYVVIPGTNSRASIMSDYQLAHSKNKIYEMDPLLNQLIESKKIRNYAIASFKTIGTSRFWIHEDEVSSYRDLILKEVTESDRWRGYAWILDVSKFKSMAEV
jgi:hypothetical protein